MAENQNQNRNMIKFCLSFRSQSIRHLVAAVIGLLLIFLISLPSATGAEPKSRGPIIDMHLHAFPADFLGLPGKLNPVTGKPSAAVTTEEIMTATLANLKRFNIVQAILCGPDRELLDKWKAAAPERIIASPMINGKTSPQDPHYNIISLRADYLAGKLGAMGEITTQFQGLSPNEPALEPYFALAEELDLPVGVHMGPGTQRGASPLRMSLGNPLELEEVLVRHPKLRLYVMHAGWPYLQEIKALLHNYPQVYVDLATLPWMWPREEFNYYLKGLLRAGYGKRLMFGSDQLFWPEAIEMAIEGIESADFLTEEQKRDIFYNNAARFLRLKQ